MTARETVLAAIREVYDVDGTLDEDELDALGDSLSRVELTMALEEAFEIDITDAEAFAWVTVGDVVAAVEGLVRA